jgi:hypothetical protein
MKTIVLIVLTILCSSIYSCKKKDDSGINAKTTADFRDRYIGTYNIYQRTVTSYYPEGGVSYAIDTTYYSIVTISYTNTDSITAYWDPSSPRKLPAVLFTYNSGNKTYYGIDTIGHFFRNTSPSGGDSGGFIGTDSIYQVFHNYTGHTSTVDTMRGHK